jgi:hypothetical protein
MSKHHVRFLRNELIEQVTAQRIGEYEFKRCHAVTLAVPVLQITEPVLGLEFDWDQIEELPGEETVRWAGCGPPEDSGQREVCTVGSRQRPDSTAAPLAAKRVS